MAALLAEAGRLFGAPVLGDQNVFAREKGQSARALRQQCGSPPPERLSTDTRVLGPAQMPD
eukprot:11154519-Lingulodinium_polyedra.AAC.1